MPTTIPTRTELAAADLAVDDLMLVHDASGTPTDKKYQAGGLRPWVLAASPWKAPVRVRTTANVDLAGGGLADGTTHDGVTVATGDRVLVASQTAPAENGIYTVPASGAASRSFDAGTADQLIRAAVKVRSGTYAGWTYTCTADPITLGSTAITWDTDAPLVASAVSLSGTYASRPSAGTAGRLYLPTDAGWITHCRDTGSAWQDFDGGLLLTPPPTSGWTWINQSTMTRTDEKGGILLELSGAAGGTGRGIYRSLPAAPYSIKLGIMCWFPNEVGTAFAAMYNPTGGAAMFIALNTIGNGIRWYVQRSNSAHLGGFGSFDRGPYGIMGGKVTYLRLQDDGTNRIYSVSQDGTTWVTVFSQSNTTHVTPTELVFGGVCNTAGVELKARLVHMLVET